MQPLQLLLRSPQEILVVPNDPWPSAATFLLVVVVVGILLALL